MLTLSQLKIAMKRLHRIPRFNSYIMTKPKSVLEHSARVAIIYHYLGGKEIFQALMHDYSEAVMGFDPPSPIKELIPEIKAFELLPDNCFLFTEDKEKDLCKLCDGIELLIDLKEQQQLGNNTPELINIFDDVLVEVMDKAKKLGRRTEVKKLINDLIS